MQRLIAGPIILLIMVIGGFIAYTAYVTKQRPTPATITATFNSLREQVTTTSPKVHSASTDAGSQLQTLAQRAEEVGQHAQNVLGTSIQVNEEKAKAPIHETAIEYGRYIYCKQVVSEFEYAQGVEKADPTNVEETAN